MNINNDEQQRMNNTKIPYLEEIKTEEYYMVLEIKTEEN